MLIRFDPWRQSRASGINQQQQFLKNEITLKFDPIQRTCRLEGGKVANEMMADARRRTLPNKSNWNDISIEC